MDDYVASGRALQYQVIQDEAASLSRGNDRYTPEEIAQATVHTRQDIVLLVWNLRMIRNQLRWLVRFQIVRRARRSLSSRGIRAIA